MGLFHRATITPSKAEVVEQWLAGEPWAPTSGDQLVVVGSFRFDDPNNRVGMEVHLVEVDGTLLQVPLTYRDEPEPAAADAFICEMEHSELGTRWVYEGLGDDRFVTMLAAVSMTGQGEALGMVLNDDRWYIAPAAVRIEGGGWGQERVPVDRFELESETDTTLVFGNDSFEMIVHRSPVEGPRPDIGLTATWDGRQNPVVLSEIRRR